MTDSMPTAAELLGSRRRVLVTGGAGFIGGAVVRRLLKESEAIVFNLDKMGYASDLTSIEAVLSELGDGTKQRHQLQRVDLADAKAVREAVKAADPDLVMHLAAESHVDQGFVGMACSTSLRAARQGWAFSCSTCRLAWQSNNE